MTDDQQPELRWAPLEPAPKRTGRLWLIIGLSVAAVAIVGVLLFLFLPRGDSPDPGASPSATPSASPSATTTPSTTPEPTQTPITTAPPATDPTVEVFRGQVSGWLNDAPRGLDIITGNNGPDALPVVETLQQDAQRLSDAQPPSSIADGWRDGVSAYAERLTELQSALSTGPAPAATIDAARTAVQDLRTLVGL